MNYRGIPRKGFSTPKLLETARAHFSCQTLEGVEIEDGGSEISAGSHFERFVYFNEALTASAFSNSAISKFSLALLHDCGWYIKIIYLIF